MFYLIFGQAYSRNYLDVDSYNKLCVNKDTKIKMPKLKTDDDTDIVYFTQEELSLLDEYFDGTNAQTAYMLGRYCGLRINECFGLKWENVNLENGTILIDRQMQYQESLIKLVPLKTKNAKRTIYMCDTLKNYFIALDDFEAIVMTGSFFPAVNRFVATLVVLFLGHTDFQSILLTNLVVGSLSEIIWNNTSLYKIAPLTMLYVLIGQTVFRLFLHIVALIVLSLFVFHSWLIIVYAIITGIVAQLVEAKISGHRYTCKHNNAIAQYLINKKTY